VASDGPLRHGSYHDEPNHNEDGDRDEQHRVDPIEPLGDQRPSAHELQDANRKNPEPQPDQDAAPGALIHADRLVCEAF
jgi:hypothetical protein